MFVNFVYFVTKFSTTVAYLGVGQHVVLVQVQQRVGHRGRLAGVIRDVEVDAHLDARFRRGRVGRGAVFGAVLHVEHGGLGVDAGRGQVVHHTQVRQQNVDDENDQHDEADAHDGRREQVDDARHDVRYKVLLHLAQTHGERSRAGGGTARHAKVGRITVFFPNKKRIRAPHEATNDNMLSLANRRPFKIKPRTFYLPLVCFAICRLSSPRRISFSNFSTG